MSVKLSRQQRTSAPCDAQPSARNCFHASCVAGKPPTEERHPWGLYALFATEMWERFGFYTAAAIMTL